MDPADEGIYCKALFKTASLFELENALRERGVPFGSLDVYYLLSLRLRANILRTNKIQLESCSLLEKEIKDIECAQVTRRSVYVCCISGCTFACNNHKRYLSHLDYAHKNCRSRFVCQYRHECERDFQTVEMLKSHVMNQHVKRTSGVQLKQNQLVQQLVTISCTKISCGNKRCVGIPAYKKHLFEHTTKKEEVQCPFCVYRTNVTGTLKQHIHRKHQVHGAHDLNVDLNSNLTPEQELTCNDGVTESLQTELHSSTINVIPEEVNEEDVSENCEDEISNEEIFVKALSIQFNTWMNISNIPWTTVSQIVQHFFGSYDKGVDYITSQVKKVLASINVHESIIENIVTDIRLNDPFKKAKELLVAEADRVRYIKDNFSYVASQTEPLRDENGKIGAYYQYVPVPETLRVVLESDDYISQKRSDPYFHEHGIIKDIRDGEVYRGSQFWNDNPEAEGLILFSDELEVVNPLGAAKTKHKMNMSYYTLVNMQPQLRTKVKSVQLVSIVPSRHWKKYGNFKCYERLLSDLKELEQEGLLIRKPVRSTVKVGLCFVVGDNLGQHVLGEFNSNFSSGYICRWCKITYKEACKESLCYNGCQPDFVVEDRTMEDHDRSAQLAEEGESDSDLYGIKGKCVFNELTAFHCVLQLPPCIGHDVLEGVLAKDIQFYLEYLFNKEKLMTVDDFNNKLKNFCLSSRDSKNRPKSFKPRKGDSKYEGNAGSLRVLSKIMTIILDSVLGESSVGKHIIKLQEMVELIFAPRLSLYEIDYIMGPTIREYLDLRISAISELGMPNLKPKHHYLVHYGRLYKEVGPLIQVWGMRLESKHVYFKKVIQAARNFKNPPMTCANRHQLAQVSYQYNGLFPKSLVIPDDSPTKEEYIAASCGVSMVKILEKVPHGAILPTMVTIWGTIYKPGMLLVLKKLDYGELKIGRLNSIAVIDRCRVIFECTTFICNQSKHNYYVSLLKVNDCEFWPYNLLGDYHPLVRLGTEDSFVFSLHHFISLLPDDS